MPQDGEGKTMEQGAPGLRPRMNPIFERLEGMCLILVQATYLYRCTKKFTKKRDQMQVQQNQTPERKVRRLEDCQ